MPVCGWASAVSGGQGWVFLFFNPEVTFCGWVVGGGGVRVQLQGLVFVFHLVLDKVSLLFRFVYNMSVQLYVGSGGANLGPYSCVASALTTEPSPQPSPRLV